MIKSTITKMSAITIALQFGAMHVTLAQGVNQLEEVVVTARKKSNVESAQDVPLSVTALQGDMLEKSFVATLTDVGKFAPAAQFNDNGTMPGTANFILRGMGFFGSIPSDEPAVGIFLDGVYLGVNSGALGNVDLLESVEVLRGPQGTLFGRNVTGGAVQLRSKRPSDEFEAKISGRLESYEGYRTAFYVSSPISDTFSASLATSYRENGDYLDNKFPGGEDRGESENFFIRPIGVYTPTDKLQMTVIYEYQDQTTDGLMAKDLLGDVATYNLKDFDIAPNINDTKGDFETQQLTLEFEYELGNGVLTTIVGWRDIETTALFDADVSSRDLLAADQRVYQDQTSIEVRYAWSPLDSLDLTTGIYYFKQDVKNEETRYFGSLAGNVVQAAQGELAADSSAIFTQGDWRISEEFVLTTGIRYTEETKDAAVASFPASLAVPGDCDPSAGTCNYSFKDDKSWDYYSGLVSLKWQFSEDAQAYTSWTRGQRSGGYNLRNSLSAGSVPGPYDEETVDAFEIGLKSEMMNRRLRLNVAAYQNQYTDLQRTVFGPGGGVSQIKLNAADAVIQGVEIEVTALLSESFTLTGWVAYTDASYDEFVGFDVDGDGNPDPELAKDLDFASVPKESAFVQLSYFHDMANGLELTASGSAKYSGKRFGDEKNVVELDSYTAVDATVGIGNSDDGWQVSLFGKNLTNEEYTDFSIISAGIKGLWSVSKPRTFGVEVSYSF